MFVALLSEGTAKRPRARQASDTLGFDCGSSCLLASAPDYLRFAQMLLDGGQAGKARLLGSGSVALLTRDQLQGRIENRIGLPGEVLQYGSSSQGYGFGVAVQTSHRQMVLPGEPGGFGVAAPGGQYFWVDPASGLVTVLLARTPDPDSALRLQRQVQALVYQAFTD
ncbi:MAG: serine hydrolase [Burkholderiaceae bacterium]